MARKISSAPLVLESEPSRRRRRTGERDGDKISISVKEEAATLRANLSLIERGTEVGLWRAVLKLDDGSELVIAYVIRQGDGALDERMSGGGMRRSKKSRQSPRFGRLSLRELLTLSKKNSRMKQANLVRLRLKQLKQLAALMKQQQELQQQEELEVEAQEVEEVAAEDEAAAAEEAAEEAAAEEEAKAKEKSKSTKQKSAAKG